MRDEIDDSYDLDGPPVGDGRGALGVLSVWGGSLAGLGLVCGLGLWAWTVTTQDPAEIPVIAAMDGPVRERPAGPEEGLTPNRDVDSYEAGAADPVEAGAAVALAPPAAEPTAEDVSLGEIEAMLGAATSAGPPPGGPAATEDAGATTGADAIEGQGAEPGTTEPPGPTPPAGIGSDLAPVASPVAPDRPVHLARRMRAASEEVVAATVALAERAAQSRWQIQLGAFRDPRLTREQWQIISGRHRSLLENRALAVQQTVSGGETFYRLRVGPFESEAEAANLCEALQARGQTCITAANR